MKFKSAQELKDHFLEKAQPIVDEYINAALGVEDLKSLNAGAREEVWDVIKQLMIQSSEKLQLDQIEGPEDIIKAVEAGKCTIKEADALLSMYKQVKDIKSDGIEGGTNIQINIMGAEATPIEVEPPQIED